jgi:uncharacterized protein (TIGR03083 family)
MEPAEYLDTIRSSATALVDAAVAAGLDAPVPSCPDWTVADLLAHVGRVHRWAAGNSVRSPEDGFWMGEEIEIPAPGARAQWARDGAEALVAALDRPADEPAWTFVPPQTVAFWQRRQAQETTMHRIDAQLAAGTADPIDPALAADGIDELLWLLPRRPWAGPITGNGETVHLHCTDVEGEWFIVFAPAGLQVERVHAKGDLAVRGTASDMLQWCSGRGPVEPLDVFGDAALLATFRRATTF